MEFTAPIIIAALAALACGAGMCGLAHRFFNRGARADAHCEARAGHGNSLSRIVPLLFSALFCGLAMAVAFAYLPPR
ncbi:MAG: hypothetical protein ACR652_24755 [Methylocystis sp.]|uniref:hypothetical protein n=1 Tax=Methylocystis sp. TaxID=1911079 RepID=UPI003DA4409F